MRHAQFGAFAAAAAVLFSLGASATEGRDVIVRFSGAIGSQPFANVGGVPVPNDVLGIPPGGRPWELLKLKARVHSDGTLRASGKGLLLGGGSNIGRPAIPRTIQATLICSADAAAPVATSPAWNSVAVALDELGNFSINAPLKPVAPNLAAVPPNPCVFPILLIRNSTPSATPGGDPTPGPWFAAGIPGGDRHDD
jgi:hypothetical protein